MKLIIASLLAVVVATIPAESIGPTQYLAPNPIESLVNARREQHGLTPLLSSKKLRQSACAKARAMLNRDYWAHTSPAGITPWYWFERVGYKYDRAGENLATGFDTIQNIVQGWMDSPAHRANLLGDYTEQGICRVSGQFIGKTTTITVQHLGLP